MKLSPVHVCRATEQSIIIIWLFTAVIYVTVVEIPTVLPRWDMNATFLCISHPTNMDMCFDYNSSFAVAIQDLIHPISRQALLHHIAQWLDTPD